MGTQRQADITLAFHQDELLRNANVSYLAVVPKFNEKGELIDDFVIEVGVYSLASQIQAEEQMRTVNLAKAEFVPRRLQVPSDSDLKTMTADFIEVEVKETAGFSIQSFTDRRRPSNGGCSVINYRYSSAGTLGGVIRLRNDSDLYFISNWHVLSGGQGRNGDQILQPGKHDGGISPVDVIGSLYWSALNNQMDVAIAHVSNISSVSSGTRCFGLFAGLGNAAVGMRVKKCGRTTEATFGIIRSVNATVKVNGYPSGTMTFVNQILSSSMSQPGDSGSLLLEDGSNRVVGLLFAGDGTTQTIHNHIGPILGGRFDAFVVNHFDDFEERMPTIEFESFAD